MTKRIKMLGILFSLTISVIGQNQVTCRIVDQETKKPVTEASVSILDRNVETTSNALGYFQVIVDTADYLIIKKQFYEAGVVKVPSTTGFQIQINKMKHADYEGGLEEFNEFFLKNVRYPLLAREKGTQGRLYVSFTIDSLGQMSNINTIKDIGNDCGLEVTELLKKVPSQWIPAEAETTFILPVIFRLGDSKLKLKEIKLPPGVLLTELVITAKGL